jgi:hypothetical protein
MPGGTSNKGERWSFQRTERQSRAAYIPRWEAEREREREHWIEPPNGIIPWGKGRLLTTATVCDRGRRGSWAANLCLSTLYLNLISASHARGAPEGSPVSFPHIFRAIFLIIHHLYNIPFRAYSPTLSLLCLQACRDGLLLLVEQLLYDVYARSSRFYFHFCNTAKRRAQNPPSILLGKGFVVVCHMRRALNEASACASTRTDPIQET